MKANVQAQDSPADWGQSLSTEPKEGEQARAKGLLESLIDMNLAIQSDLERGDWEAARRGIADRTLPIESLGQILGRTPVLAVSGELLDLWRRVHAIDSSILAQLHSLSHELGEKIRKTRRGKQALKAYRGRSKSPVLVQVKG